MNWYVQIKGFMMSLQKMAQEKFSVGFSSHRLLKNDLVYVKRSSTFLLYV